MFFGLGAVSGSEIGITNKGLSAAKAEQVLGCLIDDKILEIRFCCLW